MSDWDEISQGDDWNGDHSSDSSALTEPPFLPTGVWERIIVGGISLPFMVFFGITCLAVAVADFGQPGWLVTIILFVTKELLFAVTLLGALGFLWAIATPDWVEGFMRFAWNHLFLAIVLAAIPIPIMIVLGLCGIKLFD